MTATAWPSGSRSVSGRSPTPTCFAARPAWCAPSAGLAAATWLGRYRRRTLLVDSEEYRNRFTEVTHGYLGRDPVSPMQLLSDAHDDLLQYETVVRRAGRVTGVNGDERSGFEVSVDEGSMVRARRVVLACGVVDT